MIKLIKPWRVFYLGHIGIFNDPFESEEKFNHFFQILPGVKSARPNLEFYIGNSENNKPGYEGIAQKSELRGLYAALPSFCYEFKKGEKEIFFTFSFQRKLPNPFNRNAWNTYDF